MDRILIVDDDELFIEDMRAFLGGDFEIASLSRPDGIFELIKNWKPEVVLLDIDFGSAINGLDVLRQIRSKVYYLPVIIVSKIISPKTVVEAVKGGAVDYFDKSPDLQKMALSIRNAIRATQIEKERDVLKSSIGQERVQFIGQSSAVQRIKKNIHEVAEGAFPILITGETGTGKDLIAKLIHAASPRKGKPFLKVNCASIPETLFESELFGYEKGAFTGAQSRYAGKFELAQEGILFLDEIGEIAPALQPKLLHAIENQEIMKLGGSSKEIDVRIIAATNRNLGEEIAQKRFRKDLFYRLNVYPIAIPPLRERKEDIPFLIDFFANRYACEYRKNIHGIDEATLSFLLTLNWPGNIRELENAIQRAIISSPGQRPLSLSDFNFMKAGEGELISMEYRAAKSRILGQFHREYLNRHLRLSKGNISELCRNLNMSRQNVYNLMRSCGIQDGGSDDVGSAFVENI